VKDTASPLPIAVIGAGPVGLAAAAQLASRGLHFVVFEAGTSPGAALETFRHVRLFSPWRYDIDGAARSLLERTSWRSPEPEILPTAGELIDEYLVPLAKHPSLASRVRFGHHVKAITRSGVDKIKTAGRELAPFVLRTLGPEGEVDTLARAVLDATGTWTNPNPLGANGLPAIGEDRIRERVAYGMPDILGRERARYAGKRVLVVGSGHSAMGNLLSLFTLAEQTPSTRVVWAVRRDDVARVFGGGEKDGFEARGALGARVRALVESGGLEVHTGFRVHALRETSEGIEVTAFPGRDQASIRRIDEVIASTGARPDLELTRELRLSLDPWLESTQKLAPLIDPNVHSCGTVRPHGHRELEHPERGYYAIGARSYGRATSFLLATGYEQARSVVAALAGDLAAADEVRLELPETGVCSTDFDDGEGASGGCCGGPAPKGVAACCALDAEAKSAGQAGCGCG
jgi:thioredoxin reductase